MYVSLVTATVKPGQVDEAIRIWQEQVMPTVKQIPGIKAGRFLVDRSTNTAVSSATYDTEAEAQAAGASPEYRQAVSSLLSVITAPPQRAIYEVVVEF